jgi:polysaccharide transporter, PST family
VSASNGNIATGKYTINKHLAISMSEPTLKESIVTGAIWMGLEKWFNQILALVISVVLARLVGPTSFGLVALAGVYIAFIDVFLNQGFGSALVQRKELEDQHLDSAFWVNVIIAAVLVVGSMLLLNQLTDLFGDPRLGEILPWMSFLLIVSSFSVIPRAVLIRSMAFRALAIRTLSSTLFGGGVGLLMAWKGFGVWSLIGQQLSSGVVGSTVLWWATSWRPSFCISRRHLRDLYAFSINILGNELLWLSTQRADQLLIGVRLGASFLGPYALVSRIIQILIDVLAAPFATVALPAFSRLQDERQRLLTAFYKTTEAVATVSIPAFCGISLLAQNFIPVVFGSEWIPAVPLIQIMSVFGMLRATLSCTHPLMLAIGKPGVYFILFSFYSGLSIGLCLLATWWNSIVVVAMAMVLALCIHSVVFLLVCRRLAGISFKGLLQAIQCPIIASGLMIAVMWILRYLMSNKTSDLQFIVVTIPIAIIVYITAMMIMRPQVIDEIRLLISARLRRLLKSSGAGECMK